MGVCKTAGGPQRCSTNRGSQREVYHPRQARDTKHPAMPASHAPGAPRMRGRALSNLRHSSVSQRASTASALTTNGGFCFEWRNGATGQSTSRSPTITEDATYGTHDNSSWRALGGRVEGYWHERGRVVVPVRRGCGRCPEVSPDGA